ncbi:MAG: hypothetical protein QNL62_17400 [Gammaproteobacteria bacterium]|nr:hypothetical protein [Gammaproteobacteria bacterium]
MNKKDILNLDFNIKQKKSKKDGVTSFVQIISCNGTKLNKQQAETLTDLLRQIKIDATYKAVKNKKKVAYVVGLDANNFAQDKSITTKKSGIEKQIKKKIKAYTTDIKNKLVTHLKHQKSLTEAVHQALNADQESDYTTLALKHNILPIHLHNFLMTIPAEYEQTDQHDVYKFDATYSDNDKFSFEEHYKLLEELQDVVNFAGEKAGMVSYQKEDNELDVHGNPHAVDIDYWSLTIIKYR